MGRYTRGAALRLVARGVGLLACAWALHGCGLEDTIPVLNPPGVVLGDTLTARMQIVTATQDSGLISSGQVTAWGLEFYYRFYTDIGAVNATLATQNDLLANGFRRMSWTASTVRQFGDLKQPDTRALIQRPLLSVDPGSQESITLNFGHLQESPPTEPTIDAPGLSVSPTSGIGRGVTTTDVASSAFKDFVSDYVTTDADVSALGIPAGTTQNVYLAVYVLAYGRWDLTTDVYSRAVFGMSGYVPITVNSP